MFEFLRFGRARKDLQPKAIVEPVSDQPKKNDIRLDMIRLALKSVLRRYGIPFQWIGCEIVPMANKGDSDAMLIQLVLLKWHDALMRYAPELQKQFLNEIQFFDSSAEAANFTILWKFAPDCGYPNGQLPEAGFWVPVPESALVSEPTPLVQTVHVNPLAAAAAPAAVLPAAKFDLPKSKLDEDEGDDGFPATQIFEQK